MEEKNIGEKLWKKKIAEQNFQIELNKKIEMLLETVSEREKERSTRKME